MSTKMIKIKKEQLGINPSTAAGRLKKDILFSLVKETGRNVCFQCGEEIETSYDLSIEHKTPWLHSDNPVELYFDLNNIAYSHLECDVKAARNGKETPPCGDYSKYTSGCRCDNCRKAWNKYKRDIYCPEKRSDRYNRTGH